MRAMLAWFALRSAASSGETFGAGLAGEPGGPGGGLARALKRSSPLLLLGVVDFRTTLAKRAGPFVSAQITRPERVAVASGVCWAKAEGKTSVNKTRAELIVRMAKVTPLRIVG